MSGAIWNNLLPKKLNKYLPENAKDQAMAIYKSIVIAQKYAKGTAVRAGIDKAYRETQQLLAIAATAALVPMLLIMFALKTVDLSKEEDEKPDENKSTDGDEAEVVTKNGVKEQTKSENE